MANIIPRRLQEILDVIKDGTSGLYVNDSNTSAFDEGRKVHIAFPFRVREEDIFVITRFLEEHNIGCEVVFPGHTRTSVANYDLVVWRLK